MEIVFSCSLRNPAYGRLHTIDAFLEINLLDNYYVSESMSSSVGAENNYKAVFYL